MATVHQLIIAFPKDYGTYSVKFSKENNQIKISIPKYGESIEPGTTISEKFRHILLDNDWSNNAIKSMETYVSNTYGEKDVFIKNINRTTGEITELY